MIRMVLFGLAFLGITIGLLVFQPGSNRRAPEPLGEPVTRAEPEVAAEVAPTPVADLPPPRTVQVPVLVPTPEMLDDQSMRKLTWSTLSSLNHATGRETAPGQPGSLLHTIVRRSLDDGPPVTEDGLAVAEGDTDATGLYVVQEGDSLVSIAERVYGDMNMTGPLFAANQAILARPDDLRPGQTLVLPAR